MLRSRFLLVVAPAVFLTAITGVRGGDDPRTIQDFIQSLRDKGYYDVALQYLDRLQQDPSTPAEIRQTLDYEEGKTLIEEATRSNDPDFKKAKLEAAERKIKSFVEKNPSLPQTIEALVDLADLLFLRGQDEVDFASEARIGNERDSKLEAARGFYRNAQNAHSKAFERLDAKLAEFPKVLASNDPKLRERERIRNATMQAELKRYVDDYYNAETYPAGSPERIAQLDKVLARFADFNNRYRTQIAGFTAKMWQGKCFEEMGKLGEATGIYKDLLENTDPNLRPLQRQVAFYRIIVTVKRKEYPRAADECYEWLRLFPRDRRSYEALGVQLELAKSLIAQLPNFEGAERDRALRAATDNLIEVVHVVSPFKPEALALLQKYRPNAALSAADISKLNYDDAMAQAGQAMSTLAYENAISLLKHAITKASATREPAKVNAARYMLAAAELMLKKYYEAAVIAEHVARYYPRDPWGAKSAILALQAIVEAYTTYNLGNRTSDLEHLADLARYTAETWAETDEGDSARLMLGQIAIGRGRYPEAISAFDAVRTSSSKWIDAQTACGDAHWQLSLTLREKGNAKEAEAEVQKAVEKLKTSLKARRDANAAETDVALINNACDLAIIDLETNKPADALTLLDPIAKKLAAIPAREPSVNTAYSRVVASILRGHVSTGKVETAITDMKTLESIGGTGNNAAQLYYELGRLLEKELESLRKRNDKAGIARTEQSYQKFLKALVASKTGQTFQSLRWAADNLLKLGSPKEANEVYETLVKTYANDPAFLKTPNAGDLIYLVKLKKVMALRTNGSLPEADELLEGLLKENPRSLLAQLEKGHLLNAKAEAKKATWLEAYNHWKQQVAMKLVNQSPKPPEYFEAWYEAAKALKKLGDTEKDSKKKQTDYALAKTTLASIMRLSPGVGSPEMKGKYDALLKQLLK
jgi:tetratricopeptide (TPR) repeat protein